MILRRFHTFAPIFVLLISTISYAQKTDVITLLNTDRITGDLKSMRSGLLQLSTDNMGTIYIEWDKVEEIHTDKFFQIELDDGRIYFGSLQPSDKKGMVILIKII